jgi:hypothetical protein
MEGEDRFKVFYVDEGLMKKSLFRKESKPVS